MVSFFLLLILITGCEETQETRDYTEIRNANNIEENYRPPHARYAIKFVFEGHRYILFTNDDRDSSNGSVSSTVHDPDCPCFKKEED